MVMAEIKRHLHGAKGDVRRLFHGRSGLFPGWENWVVDWFPPVAVIRLYQPADRAEVDALADALSALPEVAAVVLQERYVAKGADHSVLKGEVPVSIQVQEDGLHFEVKLLNNQNSGLFLDMREGRRWVRHQAANKRVLNLFAYTCGFSVAAVAGGATSVVNLDMSSGALNVGRVNHRLNGHALDSVRFMSHDLFRSWGKLKKMGPYDLVIIDPPSYQKGSFVAGKDYQRVLARLDSLTVPGAQVLVCHNAPQQDTRFLQQLMLTHCPEFVFDKRLENPDDFPERDSEKGLKALVYRKRDSGEGEQCAWS